jgi:multidrug efflux pump subunit AcrB
MREFESYVVGRPEVEQVVTQGFSTSAFMQVLFTREGGLTAAPLELEETLTQRAVLVGGASISVRGEGPGFYAGGGSSALVSFRIKVAGYSYAGVTALAEELKASLERIPRVREVRVTAGSSWYGGDRGYAVTLTPDREALHRYGVTARDFAAAVSREVRGPVGRQLLEIGGDELPVTVKSVGANERTLDALRDALVPNVQGTPVRIGDLAVVDAREALSLVAREDQQYLKQVTYDFRGPQKLAKRTHDGFLASVAVPAGYVVEDIVSTFGGEDESAKGLWLVFGLGIALVVLAVALVFDSVWGAAMVLLSLPLALAGVVAAFWAAGAAFGREAAVGVILVVGLAVNQAILLVDGALARRRRRIADGGAPALDAGDVLRAARDRAGMIVLVTLSALASLVPLTIGTSATTLFGAIALATAGGTLMGTIGALFLLPPLLVGTRRTRPARKRRWPFRRRAVAATPAG